jgi:hypothetical protein
MSSLLKWKPLSEPSKANWPSARSGTASSADVQAHILVAFLGYCLWVCLKQKLKVVAKSITPARALESLRSILMVEVWFNLREGGQLLPAPYHRSWGRTWRGVAHPDPFTRNRIENKRRSGFRLS